MGNITISDLVLSPWTIKNADGLGGNVDEYRMAIGIGARLTQWYGQRINALMDDINADATAISQMSTAMGTWTPSEWDTNGSGALGGRTQMLESWGVDLTNVYDRIFFNDAGNGFAAVLPIVPYSNPPPQGRVMQSGGSYYYSWDGTNIRSVTIGSKWVSDVTQAELDQILASVKSKAEARTQTSQGKQAFLQDLIASMNKYFDFTSSILQRDERNKQEIVGHF